MSKCKLISLDTSSKKTGYAIYENGKFQRSAVIDLADMSNGEIRSEAMIKQFIQLMKEEKPDIIVVETMVVTRNAQAARLLSMIIGAVYGLCVEHDIIFSSLRPTEWRSLVHSDLKPQGRKRQDYKEWSKQVVKEIYGLDVSDDESDAILIGLAYNNMF